MMDSGTDSASPLYVEPFLGAGAVWLRTLGEDLVPPVAWMGGKRRLATMILALLGLRPGCRVAALLGDASWWGWVWPVVLDPEVGPWVSEVLRLWRAEDPRALWFRLRDMGPMLACPGEALAAWRAHPAENDHLRARLAAAAAQLLWLQARAASGVPVWWESDAAVMDAGWKSNTCASRVLGRAKQGHASELDPRRGTLVSMDGHGRGPYPAWQATCRPALLVAPGDGRERQEAYERSGRVRLLQDGSSKVDDAGQTRAREPRLVASDGRDVPRATGQRTTRTGGQPDSVPFEAGHKGMDERGGGGIVDPGTIADRLDAVRGRLVKATGGEAGFGYDDGVRRERGWRPFEPGDVANRLDTIRGSHADVIVVQASAGGLTDAAAPKIGRRALVYLDPPYQGRTGYPVTCARDEVLRIADAWARHGARVVVSEEVGLAADLGAGWSQQRLPNPRRPEWVTTFGCDVDAVVPPLARLWAAR